MRILRIVLCLIVFLAAADFYAADLTYNPVPLCRFVDTRLAGGMLTAGNPRSFRITGTGLNGQGGEMTGCGIPTGALAVHLNLVAVSPTGAGNLRGAAYPASPTRNLINYQRLTPNLNIANAITVEICDPAGTTCDFDLTVDANGASVHLVGDVGGFYTADHKHSGEDITSGTVAAGHIDAAIARDNEIMPTVLAADGETSGLDADLLDGKTSSEFALSSHDHDLQYEKKYQRTVVVTAGGSPQANGTALLIALDAITSASLNNRFLIKLEPGIYEITGALPLTMKSYVDIEGSGVAATTIRRAGANVETTGTIVGADRTELRFLTVENTGGAAYAVGIYNNSSATALTHVVVSVSGGIAQNMGIFNQNTNSNYRHVSIAAGGGFIAYGVRQETGTLNLFDVGMVVINASSTNYGVSSNSSVNAENVRITAQGGTQAFAVNLSGGVVHVFRQAVLQAVLSTTNTTVRVDGGNIQFHQSEANATGASNCTAMQVMNGAGGPSLIRNSSLRAEGCVPNNVGMNISTANVQVLHSVIEGATNTLLVSGNAAMVGSTQLVGGPIPLGGATCAGVFDETFAFFADTCPP